MISRTTDKQRHSLGEPIAYLVKGEMANTGCGKLDSERQSIEQFADLNDRQRLVFTPRERRIDLSRALNEQIEYGYSKQLIARQRVALVRDEERRNRDHVFAFEAKEMAARDKYFQRRALRQKVGQNRPREKYVFEIVNNEQGP